MKILMITPYVTITTRPELSRNKTGFGYMVCDIAKSVGKLEHVDVLCTDSRGNGFIDDGVTYLERSLMKIVINVFYIIEVGVFFRMIRRYNIKNGSVVRFFYYWMMTGYLQKLLKSNHYDIVHIHGCSFSTELWMRVCKQFSQKFVVTLHGFDSFSRTVNLEPGGKKYERDFLQRVVRGEFPITVISTGMKCLIEKTYYVNNCPYITVVCNSFSFKNKTDNIIIDIREKYNIPLSAKIILYVGNIDRNKNQGQLVEAYGMLPVELQKTTYVLFCGKPDKNYDLKSMIDNSIFNDHLIMCGGLDKAIMPDYYRQADGVALLSYTEGFGLSLIEGFHFGIPCMMFKDMDAYEDIYDNKAVVSIESRETKDVACALILLLTRQWNRDYIKKISHKFDEDNLSRHYLEAYQNIIY